MSAASPATRRPGELRRRCLAIVGLVCALSAVACNSAAKSVAYHGAVPTTAIPKPDINLTDTSGQPFNLRQQTQGFITLLYFGYTNCPDVCPTHMANIATALQHEPPDVAKQVKVVFVTTDPARDSPAVIRSWLDNFNPNFIGLTGSQDQLDQAQRITGLGEPATREDLGNGQYGLGHSAFVVAYTRDNLAHILYPDGVRQADWQADLKNLVQRGWRTA